VARPHSTSCAASCSVTSQPMTDSRPFGRLTVPITPPRFIAQGLAIALNLSCAVMRRALAGKHFHLLSRRLTYPQLVRVNLVADPLRRERALDCRARYPELPADRPGRHASTAQLDRLRLPRAITGRTRRLPQRLAAHAELRCKTSPRHRITGVMTNCLNRQRCVRLRPKSSCRGRP
jgi:hypothetical protein